MTSSKSENGGARAVGVRVSRAGISVELADGRTVIAPLDWYPRLVHATAKERAHWRLLGHGEGVHWPDLDEDLSVEGLLAGRPSGEKPSSLARWLSERQARSPRRRRAASPRRAHR